MAAPQDLLQFHDQLIDQAKKFGFDESKQHGQLRDCIIERGTQLTVRTPKSDERNFWFGFIREGEPISKAYEGLSFVLFPEYKGTHCVASIGIGSSTTADGSFSGGSLGPDMELAMKLSFSRSFRALAKKGNSNAQFFFKLSFTETVNPTPGLKEALESPNSSYDSAMINTVALYDHEDKGGLLPASILVDYRTEDGYNLIVSWLAQYAKWRNWSSFNNGGTRSGQAKAIEDAINKCKQDRSDLTPDQVLSILLEKRFIILQGAPGCGKTWMANEISKTPVFHNNTKFIQFHAETSYADFIYGIKPILNGKDIAYTYDKGALLEILDEALKPENKEKKYLLIIDEINRANLANVLGPVFYLFEQTAHNRTHKLTLGHDKDNKPIEYDHIPDNLFVIGTMNTADKSLAVVDFALRRRFAWVTLHPHVINDPAYIFDLELFKQIDNLFLEFATDEELDLQPGQSYFLYPQNKPVLDCRKDMIQYKLMPLIKEYLSEGYLIAAKDSFAQLFYSSGVVMYE